MKGSNLSRYFFSFILLLLLSSVMTMYVLNSTRLIEKTGSGKYSLKTFINYQFITGFIVCVLLMTLVWLIYSAWISRCLRVPRIIIYEADSRSFLPILILVVDLLRFWPIHWVRIFPENPTGTVIQHIFMVMIVCIYVMHNKYMQFKAMKSNALKPTQIKPKIYVSLVVLLLLSGMITRILPFEIKFTPLKSEISICSGSLQNYLPKMEFQRTQFVNYPYFLPRGRYKVEINNESNLEKLFFNAPVLASENQIAKSIEINIPLATHKLMVKSENNNSLESLDIRYQPLGINDLPKHVSNIFPEHIDKRFHEIRINVPFEIYMYYLDMNSYPLENTGFWIKGNSQTEFFWMTKHPIQNIIIRLKSLCSNVCKIQHHHEKFSLTLQEDVPIDFNLRLFPTMFEGLFLYKFRVITQKGVVPAKVDNRSRDDRNLGVFWSFNPDFLKDQWQILVSGPFLEAFKIWDDLLVKKNIHRQKMKYLVPFQSSRIRDYYHLERNMEFQNIESIYKILPDTMPLTYKKQIVRRFQAVRLLKNVNEISKLEDTDYKNAKKFNQTFLLKCDIVDSQKKQREVTLQYEWWMLRSVDENFKVFVHVIPHDEKQFNYIYRKVLSKFTGSIQELNDDHRFFDGCFPTSIWLKNDHIRYSRKLQLPNEIKKGVYDIRVGLYDSESGRKLKSENGDYWLIAGQLYL